MARDVYFEAGELDIRKGILLKLPRDVEQCPICNGCGKTIHHYFDAPSMTGGCGFCLGTGFVYSETQRGVPYSVVNQIAVANGLSQTMPVRAIQMNGPRWKCDAGEP